VDPEITRIAQAVSAPVVHTPQGVLNARRAEYPYGKVAFHQDPAVFSHQGSLFRFFRD
jgi:hypothetical protein